MLLKGFFLITTDVLGPYGIAFSMGTLGWGPGKPTANTLSIGYHTAHTISGLIQL
jgi:hypothetical protein